MGRPRQRKADAVLIPNRIREVRTTRGESTRTLAEKVTRAGYDIHYSTLAKVESGVRSLHGDLLDKLAQVLDVEPRDLLDTRDRPKVRHVPVIRIAELAALLMTGDDIDSHANFHIPVLDAGRLVGVEGYDARWRPFLRGTVVVDFDDKRIEPRDFPEDEREMLDGAIFLAVVGAELTFVRRKDDTFIDANGVQIGRVTVLGRAVHDIVRLRFNSPEADEDILGEIEADNARAAIDSASGNVRPSRTRG